jgi:uncharacterized protein (TIGR03435 family)
MLLSAAAVGVQSVDPSFEVASIKVSTEPAVGPMGQVAPDRFRMSAGLIALINYAYEIPRDRMVGVPGWATRERFDVDAKAASAQTQPQIRLMLRRLLAERFSLKAHLETREMDVYALTLARADGTLGAGIQRVIVDCDTRKLAAGSGPGLFPPDARPNCGRGLPTRIANAGPVLLTEKYAAVTTEWLASAVSTMMVDLGRPVVDKTGLAGTFDVVLQYVAEIAPGPFVGAPPAQPPDGVSLRDAIKQQLGLELRAERGPIEFFVIDSVERPSPD